MIGFILLGLSFVIVLVVVYCYNVLLTRVRKDFKQLLKDRCEIMYDYNIEIGNKDESLYIYTFYIWISDNKYIITKDREVAKIWFYHHKIIYYAS